MPDTYTARVRNIDSNGYRLIESQTGVENFESRLWRFAALIEPEDEAFIKENDVKCLWTNPDFSKAVPSLDLGCSTPAFRSFNSMVGQEAMSY